MSALIDQNFITQVSSQLKNFRRIRPGVFYFSHTCEDFTRSKVKTRGAFYQKGNQFNVYCHNCGYSHTFAFFLRELDPRLYSEYRLQSFENKNSKPIKAEIKLPAPKPKVEYSDIIFLNQLPVSNYAVKYATRRKIPIEFFDKIGLVKDINAFLLKHNPEREIKGKGVPRLVFPYYDENMEIFGFSARAFGKEMPKYLNIKIQEREMIYGLWRINNTDPIIVTEGQIDSLFLNNAVAVTGANYHAKFLRENKERVIIVPDSDAATNAQVHKSLLNAIDLGYAVSFLPKLSRVKDVNDYVKRGNYNRDEFSAHLINNACRDLKAKTELIFRKR